MKCIFFGLLLVGCLTYVAHAKREPEPAKNRNPGSNFYWNKDHMLAELRQAVTNNANDGDVNSENIDTKSDNSSGRLFMRKLLLFKKMFGKKNQQPIIIITGVGTNPTNPTTPIVPTTPTNPIVPTNPTTPIVPSTPVVSRLDISEDDDDNADTDAIAEGEQAAAEEEQALNTTLSPDAQEYIVTNEELKGTADGKASREPALIYLKHKGAKRGQHITVRIPARYKHLFKNGQVVILNTNRAGNNQKRVVRKRVNKNRRRVNNRNKNKKNKNKMKRIIAA